MITSLNGKMNDNGQRINYGERNLEQNHKIGRCQLLAQRLAFHRHGAGYGFDAVRYRRAFALERSHEHDS